jgi:hypothetical protein
LHNAAEARVWSLVLGTAFAVVPRRMTSFCRICFLSGESASLHRAPNFRRGSSGLVISLDHTGFRTEHFRNKIERVGGQKPHWREGDFRAAE